MLTLAFDTATDVATSALLEDGDLLAERTGRAKSLLEDVDALFAQHDAAPSELKRIVVGTGPGSFTSTRIGLSVARGLALALGVEGAGVSTLDALASAEQDALPILDARRGEVFVPGPRAVGPDQVECEGRLCLGDGAIRYREALEARGGIVPPDEDPRHVPRAALHASLVSELGSVESIEPIYVRAPDAERWRR